MTSSSFSDFVYNSLFNTSSSQTSATSAFSPNYSQQPAQPAQPSSQSSSGHFNYPNNYNSQNTQCNRNPYYTTTYYTNNYLNNLPSLNTITGSIPLAYYQNLNQDPDIQNRMVKYYKRKLKKWLRGDLKGLLDKVKIGDTTELKIDYLFKKIIKKYDIETILTVYINKTGYSWINLTMNNAVIKELFKYQINKKLDKQ